ncbi:MAG TPA: hypothetical protein VIT91_12730 [Chthoniobacterales bacterium]
MIAIIIMDGAAKESIRASSIGNEAGNVKAELCRLDHSGVIESGAAKSGGASCVKNLDFDVYFLRYMHNLSHP